MAERITIARPYAQALFELAREEDDLKGWSEMLALASVVAEDEAMARVIDSPRFNRDRIANLFLEVCGDKLSEAGRSFIKVLADNRRLSLLPEIAELYERHRREAEGVVEAEVVSAFPLDERQRESIAEALERRLGKKITLHCDTDDSLLGGVVIRAGDLVIEGSAAAQLRKLSAALAH